MLQHIKTKGEIDKLKMGLSDTQLSKNIMLTKNIQGIKIAWNFNENQSLSKIRGGG